MNHQLMAFTAFHTLASLVALFAGSILCLRYMRGGAIRPRTGLFLITAAVTSLTGFMFPVSHVLPSHIIGGVALAVLAVSLWARYGKNEQGGWGRVFRISNVVSTWLLAFVGVAQAFMKVPLLAAVAPKPGALPFIAAQTVLMIIFIAVGYYSVRSSKVCEIC